MLLQQGIDESIPTTHALKQDTPCLLFEEEDGPPRECATLCEKQSVYIILEIGSSSTNKTDD